MKLRILLLAFTIAALRAPAQLPDKPTGYVTDAAAVIPLVQVRTLERRCATIDQQHVAQVAIVTIQSLGGEQIDKAALDLFHGWGVERKGFNDGILIMLATGPASTH
jgi:uncharacterized protein